MRFSLARECTLMEAGLPKSSSDGLFLTAVSMCGYLSLSETKQ